MATTTVTVSKDASVMSNNWASGFDNHHPIGYWPAGYLTRALLYAPLNFAGMTAINEARLYLRAHEVAGVSHVVGDSTSNLHIRRKTADWSETANHGENSWGSGRGLDWATHVNGNYTASGESVTSFGDSTNGAWYYFDITAIVQAWFAGSPNYGVLIQNAVENNSAYAKEFYSRHVSGSEPYIYIDYSTNTPPNAPTGMSPTGNAVVHSGSTGTFTATRSDPDSGDYITGYQVVVYNDALSVVYNQEYVYPGGTPTTLSRVISGLPTNVFLQWKVRTRDKNSEWGPFCALQRFKLNSTPNAPSLALNESPTSDVKTLTPTFKVTHSDPDPNDSTAHKYQIILETSAGAAVWDSGEVSVTPVTTVSKTYNGPALSWGTSYRWRARTQDSNGQWSPYTSNATFTTHAAGVPTSLSPTGGTVVGGLAPTFTGSRASSDDSLTSAQIQVYDATGVTLIWDSGTFSSGVTSTSFSKAYAGTTLAYSTSYQWRARVTSSVGGTSAWSALQSFATPAADAVQTTAPVGSGIADLTPDFEFSRTNSFNAYQIILYAADGTTVLWDSGTVTHTSATSKTVTYPGSPALAWATAYNWKVRVSSDSGSTWGNGYTDLVSFETEEAGVADASVPSANAWLGAPYHLVTGESLDNVTGSGNSTVTLDTTIKAEGAASLKAAISALNGSDSVITIAEAFDLSDYGDQTVIKASVRASSLTSVSNIRLRFVDSGGAWSEYTVTPAGAGAFETLTATKGSPVATSGTLDWADITSIVVRVTTSASVSPNIYVDDIRIDATNPSFDGSTSGGETLASVQVKVYASDQTTEVWDSGTLAASGTTFSVAYAGTALVKGNTYYWSARYTETAGPTGGWSALSPFSLNAAPNAPTAMSPSTGAVVADDLTPDFTATFSDPDLSGQGDTPSVYEVEVYRNSDSTLMHTLRSLSPVTGENSIARASEGSALVFETEYKWRARYADSFGEYGAWSSYLVVKPSESPTVTVTAPGTTISSPAFDVTWNFTSPGSKAQNRYRVTITRDSDDVLVYDSGTVYSTVKTHAVPGGYLVNSTDYTITVVAHDVDGLASAEATKAFATAWAAPDSITGFSVSALEPTSEMLLAWDQSNLASSDFSYYLIYRRESGEAWIKYARVTDQSTTQYSDFFAGHSVTYEYKITVWKKVVGDVDVESPDSEIPTAILDPDSWQVVGADLDPSHIFELPVYDEAHTEPIQQEVFEPLGSRRKSIVRGKVLGAEGSMQVQWTDAERAAAKNYLRYITDNAGPHILKSPFGDVWLVEFSGPARKYTGGGHLGVTLNWIEVV